MLHKSLTYQLNLVNISTFDWVFFFYFSAKQTYKMNNWDV